MTPEEKQTKITERNLNICSYYLAGHKLSECASYFKLGRQRVLQILKSADVWKPYTKTNRTQFLGISISKPTKSALEREADKRGISVSRLTSDVLDAQFAEKER